MANVNLTILQINNAPFLGASVTKSFPADSIEFVIDSVNPDNSGGSVVFVENQAGAKGDTYQVSETQSEIKALANADKVSLITINIKQMDGFVQFDKVSGTTLEALICSRKISNVQYMASPSSSTTAATAIARLKVESFLSTGAAGAGYQIDDTLTISGGTGTAGVLTVTKIKPINAQTQADYNNSPSTEGTFVGGTGYAVSDTITLEEGTIITVVAVSSGVVTQFSVNSAASVGDTTNKPTLDATSTSGSGTGFQLLLDSGNQSVHTCSVTTQGLYSVLPTLPAATTTGGSGTGCTVNVDYEIGQISVSSGGSGYTSAEAFVQGGGGSGATLQPTVTAGVITSIAVTNEGNGYTSIPTIKILATTGAETLIFYSMKNKTILQKFQVSETVSAIKAIANTDSTVLIGYSVYGIDRQWTSNNSLWVMMLLNPIFIRSIDVSATVGNDVVWYNATGNDQASRLRKYYVSEEE